MTASPDPTRERILAAAGEEFAEHGFDRATVRAICRRAGANIAAVNYHFGDKQRLYDAVVAGVCALAPAGPAGAGGRPAERLRAFVGGYLARLLERGRPAWHHRLMARELGAPSAALDRLVEAVIRPRAEHVAALVRAVAGDVGEPVLRRCVASIIAQCLHYLHARPIIERLHPDWRFDDGETAAIADHIVAFSLHGLAGLRRRARRTGPRRRRGARP